MKTQIFILNYLTDDLTRKLESQFEDAVVVDNSDPPHKYDGQHVLYMGGNKGFTAAWNKAMLYGFDMLGCDAVMLCNNDIRINPEYVKEAFSRIDEKTGIATLSCNSPHKKVMESTKGTVEKPWIEFVAPIVTKKAWEEVGAFDEAFASGWGVELDYCHRVRDAGLKCVLFGDLIFHHMGQQTTNKMHGYYKKAQGEMNKYCREKYGKNWEQILKWPQW